MCALCMTLIEGVLCTVSSVWLSGVLGCVRCCCALGIGSGYGVIARAEGIP